MTLSLHADSTIEASSAKTWENNPEMVDLRLRLDGCFITVSGPREQLLATARDVVEMLGSEGQ